MDKETSSDLFLKGCNCAESTFVPFAQELGIDENIASNLSIPLGAGVGRMRNVCGAFSAMSMLCGLKFADTFPHEKKKEEIYKLVQKLAEIFKERNGSIICAELLKLAEDAKLSPIPQARNAQYYANRPCLKIVEEAAKIIQEYIIEENILQLKD